MDNYDNIQSPNLSNDSIEEKKNHFRQYKSGVNEAICNHYRNLRKNQTLEYNLNIRKKFENREKVKMTLWDAIQKLNFFVDVSDPDIELSNIHHLFQSAEKAREDGKSTWFQLTCLLHDLGKIMYLWGSDEDGTSISNQWGIVGDTFIVGCKIPNSVVYPEFNITNPDMRHPIYSTELGIYKKGCGLSNTLCSWGHDEFLYQTLMNPLNENKLPEEALYMIRYHSLYPWHSRGEYNMLEDSKDIDMYEFVSEFNKYDLYSKENKPINLNDQKTISHYTNIFNKYFPSGVIYL